MKLILASGSIWRKRLLKKYGYTFETLITDFDELKSGRIPLAIALYNAFGKATVASEMYRLKNANIRPGEVVVIGVDTIGVLGKKILCKPFDRADANKMLQSLSGKAHSVISGLVLLDIGSGYSVSAAVKTDITFKKITHDELQKYLDSNQWKGKAGAYAVQGRARGFVKNIAGDVTNVIGLPMQEFEYLLTVLKQVKF